MPTTAATLVDSARALALQFPHLGPDGAFREALARDPSLAERHFHGDPGETTPPAAGLSPAEPALVDPAEILMQHAAAGISFAEACHAHPALARAYHLGQMVARPKPASAPPGQVVAKFRAPLPSDGSLRRVAVFRAGVWNGRKYSTADLQAMVRAFEANHWAVPLSLGHEAAPDAPAVGKVSKLWIESETLFASFENVAPEVIEGIKAGKWLSLSCEIFIDVARNGVRYPAALRSIALLGAHVPGVDLPTLADVLGGRA